MYLSFIKNHVLANLTFVLILLIGFISYNALPRQQDPDINFNWIIVSTALPGASAEDIEKKITDPIEDAISGLSDIKFISSNSRENISSLLIRFNQIDERVYDKRVADLRRQIQSIKSTLPSIASDPFILEIISANAFPSAMVIVKSAAYDENLRFQTNALIKDIKQLKGVDRVDNFGQNDPELHINYLPEKLQQYKINPAQLADSIRVLLTDKAVGKQSIEQQNWLVRLDGSSDPSNRLKQMSVMSEQAYIPLNQLADISISRETADQLVSVDQQPAILLSIMKQGGANTLDLIERVKQFVQERNTYKAQTGVELILINDQSEITTKAINIMQTNALFGLAFVLVITFIFMGYKMSLITTMGIPFILAGTFWFLFGIGQTLNVSVLLAVVIALGMLVDDAVVVAESIYHRISLGEHKNHATVNALKEVFAPVTTAVMTTMAAFLPLMLLPGILGEFMRMIPLVVTISLMISLVEAYWMLPAHTLTMNIRPDAQHKTWRFKFTHKIRLVYTRTLIKILRIPKMTLLVVVMLFASSIYALSAGFIKMDFFASDTIRLFYINLELPAGTSLQTTQKRIEQLEQKARTILKKDEYREIASYSGAMFTETEPLFGNHYAQVLVGLKPKELGMRTVEKIIEDLREPIMNMQADATNLSFLKLAGGIPVTKPIDVKIRGEQYQQIRKATDEITAFLKNNDAISDISDDANLGSPQLTLKLKHQAIKQYQVDPNQVQRTIQLMIDGEIVSSFQKDSVKNNVRLLSSQQHNQSVDELLQNVVINLQGHAIPLSLLVTAEQKSSLGNIRHYNFKRTITLQADIDKTKIDEVTANDLIKEHWAKIQYKYPTIALDFSGILDDIEESINSIIVLFVFGVGVMYMILGAQFKSYFQPLLILTTVPLAFMGVIMGILITKNPLSLYTLYGVVALAGIAVNSAIVLISTANMKLNQGMSVLHATVYAARRRVIPIIITTLTTIGGLMSLALGLGGESLIWGPVANAIVWGLGISSTLTLFVVPILYRTFMRHSHINSRRAIDSKQ
ncbi:MAG: efflux RND transporter permease subunit [Gammaproteobacteria bacterium]|nr:efflux RND transporter permease subunit [Gammaproteobacteria bacterium]